MSVCGALHRQNFYPRSPRGERRAVQPRQTTFRRISIHAPREGSDRMLSAMLYIWFAFLSTLPARGATVDFLSLFRRVGISIHAPREGSDAPPGWLVLIRTVFLSTLPARGATYTKGILRQTQAFLSTLPARGATEHQTKHRRTIPYFYPRSPRGERPPDLLPP